MVAKERVLGIVNFDIYVPYRPTLPEIIGSTNRKRKQDFCTANHSLSNVSTIPL